jgi:hypothetical protein
MPANPADPRANQLAGLVVGGKSAIIAAFAENPRNQQILLEALSWAGSNSAYFTLLILFVIAAKQVADVRAANSGRSAFGNQAQQILPL